MMNDSLTDDTKAIILLCGVFGKDPSKKPLTQSEYTLLVRWLINSNMHPRDLLQKGHVAKASTETGIDRQRLESLLGRGVQMGFAVEEWQRNGIWIISRSDSDYPTRYKNHLKEEAPPLLFGVGNRSMLAGGGLAIVGSRNIDKDGEDFTRITAESCAFNGMPVVSGGARGVDQFAMTAALEADGIVIGILAEKLLKKSLERSNRDAIADGKLLLLSPYHPNARFTVKTAMSRNKLIYAMADYGLVVNADYKKGGTWAGAEEELKRDNALPVFVRIGNNTLDGNSKLLDLGAIKWVDSTDQNDLKQRLTSLVAHNQKKCPEENLKLFEPTSMPERVSLECDQEEIVEAVSNEKSDVELRSNRNGASNSIYQAVLPVILNNLETPTTIKELAELLTIGQTQLNSWVKKAVEEKKIIKLLRPVRYQKAEQGKQMIGENIKWGVKVAELLEELNRLTDSSGTYAYRGQENAIWNVESAAYRRLEKNDDNEPTMERFISYHEKEILEQARMNGYGMRDGRELQDLELLADLQHFSAATCLIDFTRNFLVALWFACKDTKTDGKIFILNTNDPKTFRSLENKDLEREIKDILTFQTRAESDEQMADHKAAEEQPSYWHWAPHGLNQRILKQDSLFIFGKPTIGKEHLKEIAVPQQDKVGILEELRVLGVVRESLFKDVPGFAASHGADEPISLKRSAEAYFQEGNEAYQRGDLEKAIQLYDNAIEINPDYVYAYNNRGIAKFRLGDRDGAIADYSKAIKIKPYYANIYGRRGFAKFSLGDYKGAIADYNKVIKYNPDYANIYYMRGMAKYKLDNHEGAIADFNKAIKIKSDDPSVYYNRGIAYKELNNREAARNDFLQAKVLAKNIKDAAIAKEADNHLSGLDD